MLMWGGIAALVLIVAAVIFGLSLGIWFSVAMIALAGGSILYQRSEEHTSELQSLMRISYAVFCLKKKHKTQKQPTYKSTSTIQPDYYVQRSKTTIATTKQ